MGDLPHRDFDARPLTDCIVHMTQNLQDPTRRKLNFFQTLKAVAWALFGVRKGSGYQEDVGKLNPLHVIVAGLLAAAIFVFVLVSVVRLAVA